MPLVGQVGASSLVGQVGASSRTGVCQLISGTGGCQLISETGGCQCAQTSICTEGQLEVDLLCRFQPVEYSSTQPQKFVPIHY